MFQYILLGLLLALKFDAIITRPLDCRDEEFWCENDKSAQLCRKLLYCSLVSSFPKNTTGKDEKDILTLQSNLSRETSFNGNAFLCLYCKDKRNWFNAKPASLCDAAKYCETQKWNLPTQAHADVIKTELSENDKWYLSLPLGNWQDKRNNL